MYSFDKYDCYDRAKQLLKDDDIASSRYACLEIRQCIEAIAYEKVKMYQKYIPINELNTWQPKKIFDFLENLNSLSTKDFELSVFEQDEETGEIGRKIFTGRHKTLKSYHLKKIYNKLGSYLHTPTINKQNEYSRNLKNLKAFLLEVMEELEPIIDSNIDSNLGSLIKFNCKICKYENYIFKNKLTNNPIYVNCINDDCNASYKFWVDKKNEIQNELNAYEVKCACGKEVPLLMPDDKDEWGYSCECGLKYEFVKQWLYRQL